MLRHLTAACRCQGRWRSLHPLRKMMIATRFCTTTNESKHTHNLDVVGDDVMDDVPHPLHTRISGAILVDIDGSRRITADHVLKRVVPCVRAELAMAAPFNATATTTTTPSASSSSSHAAVRLCALATQKPKLQDVSWASMWMRYLGALRERSPLMPTTPTTPTSSSSSSSVRVACLTSWGDDAPLLGRHPLPVELIDYDNDDDQRWLVECFRVDDFIPITTQLQFAVRHVLATRRPPSTSVATSVAVPHVHPPIHVIGIVAGDHLTQTYSEFLEQLHRDRAHANDDDGDDEVGDVRVLLFNSRRLVKRCVV